MLNWDNNENGFKTNRSNQQKNKLHVQHTFSSNQQKINLHVQHTFSSNQQKINLQVQHTFSSNQQKTNLHVQHAFLSFPGLPLFCTTTTLFCTLLPNFLGWVDYLISLVMGLEAPRVELRCKLALICGRCSDLLQISKTPSNNL